MRPPHQFGFQIDHTPPPHARGGMVDTPHAGPEIFLKEGLPDAFRIAKLRREVTKWVGWGRYWRGGGVCGRPPSPFVFQNVLAPE